MVIQHTLALEHCSYCFSPHRGVVNEDWYRPRNHVLSITPWPLRLLRRFNKKGGAVVALANLNLKFLLGVVH